MKYSFTFNMFINFNIGEKCMTKYAYSMKFGSHKEILFFQRWKCWKWVRLLKAVVKGQSTTGLQMNQAHHEWCPLDSDPCFTKTSTKFHWIGLAFTALLSQQTLALWETVDTLTHPHGAQTKLKREACTMAMAAMQSAACTALHPPPTSVVSTPFNLIWLKDLRPEPKNCTLGVKVGVWVPRLQQASGSWACPHAAEAASLGGFIGCGGGLVGSFRKREWIHRVTSCTSPLFESECNPLVLCYCHV